jgi:hypothetical protein
MILPYINYVGLESIQWNTDVFELDESKKYNDKTFSSVFIYTSADCTKVQAVLDSSLPANRRLGNARNVLRTWNYNAVGSYILNPDDAVIDEHGNIITANIQNNKSYYKVTKLMGDFFIVRLIYDNSEQFKIYLNYINANINAPFATPERLIK